MSTKEKNFEVDYKQILTGIKIDDVVINDELDLILYSDNRVISKIYLPSFFTIEKPDYELLDILGIKRYIKMICEVGGNSFYIPEYNYILKKVLHDFIIKSQKHLSAREQEKLIDLGIRTIYRERRKSAMNRMSREEQIKKQSRIMKEVVEFLERSDSMEILDESIIEKLGGCSSEDEKIKVMMELDSEIIERKCDV